MVQLDKYPTDPYVLELSHQMMNVCLLISDFLPTFYFSCILGTYNCFSNKLIMVRPTFPILTIPLVGQQDGAYVNVSKGICYYLLCLGFQSLTIGKLPIGYLHITYKHQQCM